MLLRAVLGAVLDEVGLSVGPLGPCLLRRILLRHAAALVRTAPEGSAEALVALDGGPLFRSLRRWSRVLGLAPEKPARVLYLLWLALHSMYLWEIRLPKEAQPLMDLGSAALPDPALPLARILDAMSAPPVEPAPSPFMGALAEPASGKVVLMSGCLVALGLYCSVQYQLSREAPPVATAMLIANDQLDGYRD